MSSGYVNIPAYGSPSWKSPIDTAVDLPANGNQPGDARVVIDTSMIYIWNGTMWVAVAGGGGGGGITQLTGDVSAGPGSGSQAATVNSVGGSAAASVHTAQLGFAAATSSNTPNTLVLRDGAGSFLAGEGSFVALNTTGSPSGAEIFGTGNTVSGSATVVVGDNNTVSGGFNTIIGSDQVSLTGSQNTTLGYGCNANGGNSNLLIGNQANSSADFTICLGIASSTSGDFSCLVGSLTEVQGTQATAIGGQALVTGPGGTAIGFFSYADANGSSIGFNAIAQFNSIAIGSNSFTTAPAQAVFGGIGSPLTQIYFGTGPSDSAPPDYTINGTGASGTDISGGSVSIAGGIGTGAGSGGSVRIQTTFPAATGSTPNTLATVASFAPTGIITLGASGTTPIHAVNGLTTTGGATIAALSNVPTAATAPTGYLELHINGVLSYIPYFQ